MDIFIDSIIKLVIIDKSIIAKEALVLQCLCVADSLQTSAFVNIYLIHTRAFPFRKCEGTKSNSVAVR